MNLIGRLFPRYPSPALIAAVAETFREMDEDIMAVDSSALRILAVGNHQAGYQGMVRISSAGTGFDETRCLHRHPTTTEARNCIRNRIRWALAAVADQEG